MSQEPPFDQRRTGRDRKGCYLLIKDLITGLKASEMFLLYNVHGACAIIAAAAPNIIRFDDPLLDIFHHHFAPNSSKIFHVCCP